MADQPKQLKVNDEVFIESHGMMGKVVRVRPDGDEEPFYEVEIKRYFSRDQLELIDREADAQKRRQEMQAKSERLEAARARVQPILAAGGTPDPAASIEFLKAADEMWQALGHRPLIISKKTKP